MKERLSGQKGLFIGAHPDDIEIFAGGTVALWAEEGMEIHNLIVTDGAKGGSVEAGNESLQQTRKKESLNAAEVLGVNNVESLDFPDKETTLLDIPKIVSKIQERIKALNPTKVATHGDADTTLHGDHVKFGLCVNAAIKGIFEEIYGLDFLSLTKLSRLPFPPPISFEELLTFHLPSPDRFNLKRWGEIIVPPENIVRVDVSRYVSKKLEATGYYESQKGLMGFFRENGLLEIPEESFIQRIAVIDGRIVCPVPMPLGHESYRIGRK